MLPLLVRGAEGQVVEWYETPIRAPAAPGSWCSATQWPAQRVGCAADRHAAPGYRTRRADRAAGRAAPLLCRMLALGDGRSLVKVKMATALDGWALAQAPGNNAGERPALLTTHDGGQSWQEIALPVPNPEPESRASQPPPSLSTAATVATVARTATVPQPLRRV